LFCRNLASKKKMPPHPGPLPQGGEGGAELECQESTQVKRCFLQSTLNVECFGNQAAVLLEPLERLLDFV
jgi:hypothetical protein